MQKRRANLLGQEHVDGRARIGLAEQFGELLLDGLRDIQRRIAELDPGDMQRFGIDMEQLHAAVAAGIGSYLMFDRGLQSVSDQKLSEGFRGLIRDGAGFGERAVIKGNLRANCVAQLAVRKPREIVEVCRNTRRLFDVESENHAVGTRLKIVANLGEHSALHELVGSALQVVFSDLRVQLQAAEGGDLLLLQRFEPFGADFAQRGSREVGALRPGRSDTGGQQNQCSRNTCAHVVSLPKKLVAAGSCARREILFDGDGFRQVAGLVNVAAAAHGDVIRKELQRNDFEQRGQEFGR